MSSALIALGLAIAVVFAVVAIIAGVCAKPPQDGIGQGYVD